MAENKGRLAYTIPDACEQLGVGRSMLYELIGAGEVRTIKVGTRTLVPESELSAFIQRKLKEAA